MSRDEYEAEVDAFIRSRGVTRCPTACVAPTQGSANGPDRVALRQRADRIEAAREEKKQRAQTRMIAAA